MQIDDGLWPTGRRHAAGEPDDSGYEVYACCGKRHRAAMEGWGGASGRARPWSRLRKPPPLATLSWLVRWPSATI